MAKLPNWLSQVGNYLPIVKLINKYPHLSVFIGFHCCSDY